MVLKQGPRLPIVGKGCMQYTWEIRRTLWHQWRAASQQHIVQESTANKHVNGMNDEPSCRKKNIQQPQTLEHVYLFHSFLIYPGFFGEDHFSTTWPRKWLTPTWLRLWTSTLPWCPPAGVAAGNVTFGGQVSSWRLDAMFRPCQMWWPRVDIPSHCENAQRLRP